jgi:hypothetical protein
MAKHKPATAPSALPEGLLAQVATILGAYLEANPGATFTQLVRVLREAKMAGEIDIPHRQIRPVLERLQGDKLIVKVANKFTIAATAAPVATVFSSVSDGQVQLSAELVRRIETLGLPIQNWGNLICKVYELLDPKRQRGNSRAAATVDELTTRLPERIPSKHFCVSRPLTEKERAEELGLTYDIDKSVAILLDAGIIVEMEGKNIVVAKNNHVIEREIYRILYNKEGREAGREFVTVKGKQYYLDNEYRLILADLEITDPAEIEGFENVTY